MSGVGTRLRGHPSAGAPAHRCPGERRVEAWSRWFVKLLPVGLYHTTSRSLGKMGRGRPHSGVTPRPWDVAEKDMPEFEQIRAEMVARVERVRPTVKAPARWARTTYSGDRTPAGHEFEGAAL